MARPLVWVVFLSCASVLSAQNPSGWTVRPAGPTVLPIIQKAPQEGLPIQPLPSQRPILPRPEETAPLPRRSDPSAVFLSVNSDPPAGSNLRLALDKLKTEREALARQRQAFGQELAASGSRIDEATQLRLKIAEAVGRLGAGGRSEGSGKQPDPPPVLDKLPERDPRPVGLPITPAGAVVEPADKLTLAQALYQAGDTEVALRELRQLDASRLSRRDKAWVHYLTAGCLRKLGNLSEAAVIYREVADAREEEFLTESAIWHLGLLRWRQDMQKQLDDARKRRESR